MQRTPFTGADLSDGEIERLIERAKVARVQFLYDNRGRALRSIGWSGFAFGLALLVVVGAHSARHQMLENTTVIERLATKLARTERIDPGTLREVAQLLRRPDYDCRQIACNAWLERRNAAARAALKTILAKHSLPATVAETQ
jgi:hypothetical protein